MRTTARYPRLIVVAVFCGLPSLAGAVPITHRLDGFEVMVEINSRFLIQLATTDGFIEGVIDSGDVQSAESFGTIVLDIEPGPLDGQVDVVVPQGGIDSGSFRFGTSGNLHLDPLVNPINVFTELDLRFDIGSDPFAGSAVDPIAPFGDMLSSDHVDLDLDVFWNFGMSGFTGTGPFEAAEDGLLDTTVRASGFGQLAELQPTGSQFSLNVGDFAPPPIEIAPRNAAAFTLTPGCDLPEGTFGCRFDILGVQMSVLEFSMTISSIRMFGSQTGMDFAVGPVEPPVSVPEPTTLWLLGAGLIGMCLLKRRQIATARRFAPTLADR